MNLLSPAVHVHWLISFQSQDCLASRLLFLTQRLALSCPYVISRLHWEDAIRTTWCPKVLMQTLYYNWDFFKVQFKEMFKFLFIYIQHSGTKKVFNY